MNRSLISRAGTLTLRLQKTTAKQPSRRERKRDDQRLANVLPPLDPTFDLVDQRVCVFCALSYAVCVPEAASKSKLGASVCSARLNIFLK